MFKAKLLEIKRAIERHQTVALTELVKLRLDKTFNLYVQQLEISYNRLLQVGELKLLQQLSKEE